MARCKDTAVGYLQMADALCKCWERINYRTLLSTNRWHAFLCHFGSAHCAVLAYSPADVRMREGSDITDPCIRGDHTAGVLEGVENELAFVNEIWDVDVRSVIEAVKSKSICKPRVRGADWRGGSH